MTTQAIHPDDMPSFLAGLRQRIHLVPDEARKCKYLRADEDECVGGMHHIAGTRTTRVCRGERLRSATMPLLEALSRCGFTGQPGDDPVPALLAALRPEPATAGLDMLLELLRAVAQPTALLREYHVLIHGTVGTAKTHAMLTLYFDAIRKGARAVWTSWADWRDRSLSAERFDEREAGAAEGWFDVLERADVVVIDDLLFVPWAGGAERTRVCSRLGRFLEKRQGRTLISTNLDTQQLEDEAALGSRLVSRLTETRVLVRKGETRREPTRVLKLRGPDQRGRR